MSTDKSKKINTIATFIIFISVFWCVFFFEDAINYFSTKSSNSDYTTEFDSTTPNDSTVINGQKIDVLNGTIKMSGEDFLNKIKSEIAADVDKKLIHSKFKGNRYFITYKFKKKTISALIIDNGNETSHYQVYKSGGKLKDGGELPDSKIPYPPDAVSLINLKGKKGKLFFSFNTQLTAEEVKIFYRKRMKALGWVEEDFKLPQNSSIYDSENQHETVEIAFMKDRKTFVVSIKMDVENAISMVTVFKS